MFGQKRMDEEIKYIKKLLIEKDWDEPVKVKVKRRKNGSRNKTVSECNRVVCQNFGCRFSEMCLEYNDLQ